MQANEDAVGENKGLMLSKHYDPKLLKAVEDKIAAETAAAERAADKKAPDVDEYIATEAPPRRFRRQAHPRRRPASSSGGLSGGELSGKL